MKVGLQLKVTALILALTTVIILSLGVYVAHEKNLILTQTGSATARKELASLSFIASRALLDRDDLALADSLQNAQGLPGFTFGGVFKPKEKTILISRTGKTYSQQVKEIELDAAKTVNENWDKIVTSGNEVVIPVIKSFPGNNKYRLHYFHKAVFHPFVKVNPPLLAIAQVAMSDEYIKKSIWESQLELMIVGVGFFIFGIIGAYFLSRFIVKPVRILSKGAQDVAAGNLDVELPPLGSDELGQLALQFNEMTANLKKARDEQEEQAVVNEQIKQAQEIQEGMNPSRFFKKPEFQIKGFTRAAKGVGGDYYDFQLLADGRLAVLISDVSGKSISASLVMVLIKTVVSTYLRLFNTIRGDVILRTVNRVMCGEAHIDKFATILFFILDPLAKTVEFSNGGHGPLFIYRADRKVCTTSKLEGLPLGIEEDNVYRLAKLPLSSGDIIFLYTDGISECWNKEKEEFGLKRIREKILEYAELNPKEIIDRLVKDLDEFANGAEQHDDMTMVVLKIL